MTCLYCTGHLQETTVSRVQEYEGQWYLIENVPARVCQQCSAIFYTPEAHDLILKLVTSQSHPKRVETLDVLDASQAL